jgi:hypothetical protein
MSTRKPHEEDWALDRDGDVRRKNRRGDMTTLVCLKAATGELEEQALIAAAPDMARALVAVLEWDKISRELPEDPAKSPMGAVRAALAKAGVPIP